MEMHKQQINIRKVMEKTKWITIKCLYFLLFLASAFIAVTSRSHESNSTHLFGWRLKQKLRYFLSVFTSQDRACFSGLCTISVIHLFRSAAHIEMSQYVMKLSFVFIRNSTFLWFKMSWNGPSKQCFCVWELRAIISTWLPYKHTAYKWKREMVY